MKTKERDHGRDQVKTSEHTHYLIHCSITGHAEQFETAASAAAAFFEDSAKDRSCIIVSNGRSARVLAQTIITGDQSEKFIPHERDPYLPLPFLDKKGRGRVVP